MPQSSKKARAENLWIQAEQQEEKGKMRDAFRLMLAAAKLGSISAQINVGNYYDDGRGVGRNRSAALYWFKRAYRRGDSGGAHNIGVVWRNEGKPQRSLYWFTRAVKLGDDESNLDIGKHFLDNEKDPQKAILYFKRVRSTGWVSEAGIEEAAQLIREAKKRLKTKS
jgi:TPR repeat protein